MTPNAPQPASWLKVSLTRLTNNVAALQSLIGDDVGINAVIKKDAYGLGGPQLGRALIDAGCKMLTVWSPQEAQALVDASIKAPVLVLMPVWQIDPDSGLHQHAQQGLLNLTIHSLDQLPSLNACAQQLGITIQIQLMLDTGMSRGALAPNDFKQAIQTLPDYANLHLNGVFSHFATADTGPGFVGIQAKRFNDVLAGTEPLHGDPNIHLANSFGLLLEREHHHQMVRPGLLLLGYARPGVSQKRLIQGAMTDSGQPVFQPIVQWLSKLIHTHPQPAGATVGYGATCTLHRNTMIGLVPVGYADGYPVALSNRAVVRIFNEAGKLLGEAAVLGRVNMDQITIDLTDLKNAGYIDWPNYTVELFADDWQAKNSVPNLAAFAETHAYEIICRVANHVPRVYPNPQTAI